MTEGEPARIELTIEIDPALRFLLPRQLRQTSHFTHVLTRQASLKDVVESLGIPHTEIGALRVDGDEVDFRQRAKDGRRVSVAAVEAPFEVTQPTLLRPHPLPVIRFLVDANVGRLARLLRAAGCDTAYRHAWHDPELAGMAASEGRILLTRDRALLRYACVEFGHLVRSDNPRQQLAEVIGLFGLQDRLKPFSRCMLCNGLLHEVAKDEVCAELEPLTRIYYHVFQRCGECHQIYWEGTHEKGLREIISQAVKNATWCDGCRGPDQGHPA